MGEPYATGDSAPETAVTLVSTRTIDRMPLSDGSVREQAGGPAHYIGEALRNLGRSFTLLTGAPAVVDVVLGPTGEEYIIPALPTIEVPAYLTAPAVIYSPIMQEIDHLTIPEISGLLVIDLQGFVREPNTPTGKSHHQFDLSRLLERADVIKASPSELARLDSQSRRLLAGGMLLETLGEEGLILSDHGLRYRIPSRPVKAPDTIGAGDNLLAAFVHFLLLGQSPRESAEQAARFTEKVLRDRHR